MHGTLRQLPFAVVRAALAITIVAGSLIMWIGIPLAWIWAAGQLSHDYPSIYMAALGGCPLTMIGWGWMLFRVNAVYQELAPPPPDAPGVQRSAWLGSMSGERRPRRRQASLLDLSMIVSVIIALTAMAVWFFAFAHTSGPVPE
jgi:hypothetical protein